MLKAQLRHPGFGAMAEIIIWHAAKGNRAPLQDIAITAPQARAAIDGALRKGWPAVIHIEFADANYNDKYEQEMTKTGDVCEDTEILINGVLATLADLRVGESVRGQVRVEGKEPNKELRELTVLRIIVDRPATIATPPHASVAATGSADNRKAQDRP